MVFDVGSIVTDSDSFNSEDFIYPLGFSATRIFWSATKPRTRTVWSIRITEGKGGGPLFSVTPADDQGGTIEGPVPARVFKTLWRKVQTVNRACYSGGPKGEGVVETLPVMRWEVGDVTKLHGLNAPHFLGYGLRPVQEYLEKLDDAKFLCVPLRERSIRFRFR